MSETYQATLPDSLPHLAEQIRDELRAGVEHAARAGAMLIEAKAHVRHGQWLCWLHENFGLSERSAQNFMRLSRKMAELPAERAQRVAELPLRDAIESFVESRNPPANVKLSTDTRINQFRFLRDDILGRTSYEDIYPRMSLLYPIAMEIIDASQDIEILVEMAKPDLLEHLTDLKVRTQRIVGQAIFDGKPKADMVEAHYE